MNYKHELIELMVRAGVLTFGDFTAKSGRKTPYFVNTGNFKMGAQLAKLGEFYAKCIHDNVGTDFTSLYGPAYKGIPLAAATAISLSNLFGVDKPYTFNRKEEKDHGEGGSVIGYKPQNGDRVVITEDVVTAGTAMRETVEIFKGIANVKFEALIVLCDRGERGTGDKSAIQELEETIGIKVYPIITVYDIIDYLYGREIDGKIVIDDEIKARIEKYLEEYGI